jgi:ribonuclease P/MRP protein subunit RPP40
VFVRSHLDYCAHLYSPYLKKGINTLENLQKRATKLDPQLNKLDYDTRLAKLNLQPLKDRRVRGDLIEMYKVFNGQDIVNLHKPFCWNSERILETNSGSTGRYHKHRIIREIVPHCQAGQNFFPNRVSQAWNRLNLTIVYQPTPNDSKTLQTTTNPTYLFTIINLCWYLCIQQ